MDKVVLFGNGELAGLFYYYLTYDSPYEVVGFTVDRDYMQEESLFGLPIVAFEDVQSIFPPDEYKMLVSIGYQQVNKLRAAKYYEAKEKGYELINYISSKAVTWPGLVVGDNCFIMENNVLQPFVEIGSNIIMAVSNVVAHHTVIKDHCFLASHVVVSGNVTVEPYCFLGANATLRDGIVIARECILGAGALILKNTQERGVYIGNPAHLFPEPSNQLRRFQNSLTN